MVVSLYQKNQADLFKYMLHDSFTGFSSSRKPMKKAAMPTRKEKTALSLFQINSDRLLQLQTVRILFLQ